MQSRPIHRLQRRLLSPGAMEPQRQLLQLFVEHEAGAAVQSERGRSPPQSDEKSGWLLPHPCALNRLGYKWQFKTQCYKRLTGIFTWIFWPSLREKSLVICSTPELGPSLPTAALSSLFKEQHGFNKE